MMKGLSISKTFSTDNMVAVDPHWVSSSSNCTTVANHYESNTLLNKEVTLNSQHVFPII